MHLEDGTEVKAYRLRKEDGTSDRWSAVYWIDREGKTQSVYADRFSGKRTTGGQVKPPACDTPPAFPSPQIIRKRKGDLSIEAYVERSNSSGIGPTMPTGKEPVKCLIWKVQGLEELTSNWPDTVVAWGRG